MTNLIERLTEWFNGLSGSEQLDEIVLDYLAGVSEWFLSLSSNQQLIVVAVGIGFLLICLALFKGFTFLFSKLRKLYRRKRIPSKFNLHLDGERNDLKHGEDLRRNMKKMSESAPFKEK